MLQNIYLIILLLFFGSSSTPQPLSSSRNQLTITVTGFKEMGGNLYIGVYDNQDDFLDDERLYTKGKMRVNEEEVSYTFYDLEEGTYAVALYYDVNEDGKCNRVMGLPTEGYGFSNNVRGYPSYDKVKFEFEGGSKQIDIELLYWFG